MKKSILCVALLFFTFACPISAPAKAIRCHGEYTWYADQKSTIRLYIVFPEKLDLFLTLDNKQGKFVNRVSSQPVGKGIIEIIWGVSNRMDRLDFIVTKMPDSGESLFGFFMNDNFPSIVRVDLWDENKPFVFYDAFSGRQLTQGQCEE